MSEPDPVETDYASVRWFEALGRQMEADRADHERIGEIDLTCVFTFFDTDDGDVHIRCEFEEFSLVAVDQLDDDFDPESVDFILEADVLDWNDMFDHIRDRAGAVDREFTLNYLSLPGTPVRCWSPDPLGRDVFFRFNQSLQQVMNGAAAVTEAEAAG